MVNEGIEVLKYAEVFKFAEAEKLPEAIKLVAEYVTLGEKEVLMP